MSSIPPASAPSMATTEPPEGFRGQRSAHETTVPHSVSVSEIHPVNPFDLLIPTLPLSTTRYVTSQRGLTTSLTSFGTADAMLLADVADRERALQNILLETQQQLTRGASQPDANSPVPHYGPSASYHYREMPYHAPATISEKQHHVGGLGDPPKANHSARNAMEARTMMLWTAARAE
jgi:hypothetical protein